MINTGVPQGCVIGPPFSSSQFCSHLHWFSWSWCPQITWCLYCVRSSACSASSASSCASGGRANGEKSARGTSDQPLMTTWTTSCSHFGSSWDVSSSSWRKATGRPSRSAKSSWAPPIGRVRGRRRRRRRRRQKASLSSRMSVVEQRRESSPLANTLRLQCSPVGDWSVPCTAPVHPSKHPTGPQATAPKTTAGKMSVPLWLVRKTSETIVYKKFKQRTRAMEAREAARQRLTTFGKKKRLCVFKKPFFAFMNSRFRHCHLKFFLIQEARAQWTSFFASVHLFSFFNYVQKGAEMLPGGKRSSLQFLFMDLYH